MLSPGSSYLLLKATIVAVRPEGGLHMATPARIEPRPAPLVLGREDGLRLQSGPGRDLTFKITGEQTGGAFDYSIVEVAPHGGPPLHVHHIHAEAIHALEGRYKVRIG